MATANRILRARRALIPALAVLCALCYATTALAVQDTRAIWSAAIVGPLSGPPAAVPRGVVRDVTRDITLPSAPAGARLLLAGGPTGAELIDGDDVAGVVPRIFCK